MYKKVHTEIITSTKKGPQKNERFSGRSITLLALHVTNPQSCQNKYREWKLMVDGHNETSSLVTQRRWKHMRTFSFLWKRWTLINSNWNQTKCYLINFRISMYFAKPSTLFPYVSCLPFLCVFFLQISTVYIQNCPRIYDKDNGISKKYVVIKSVSWENKWDWNDSPKSLRHL